MATVRNAGTHYCPGDRVTYYQDLGGCKSYTKRPAKVLRVTTHRVAIELESMDGPTVKYVCPENLEMRKATEAEQG